ncbi:MAG: hypothetical protein V1809_03795 [Planctomycetota bacterium]
MNLRITRWLRSDRGMSHERLSRLMIGGSVLLGWGVGFFVTPWGYAILLGTAVNLIRYAFTGQCEVKDLLDRLGVPYDPPPAHLVRRPPAEAPKPVERKLRTLAESYRWN